MDTVTEQTLRDLIASGETLTVEFKSDLKQAKQANKRTLSGSLSVFSYVSRMPLTKHSLEKHYPMT